MVDLMYFLFCSGPGRVETAIQPLPFTSKSRQAYERDFNSHDKRGPSDLGRFVFSFLLPLCLMVLSDALFPPP